ncbi:hypothetical protein D3C78_1798050 [compost metagenome]
MSSCFSSVMVQGPRPHKLPSTIIWWTVRPFCSTTSVESLRNRRFKLSKARVSCDNCGESGMGMVLGLPFRVDGGASLHQHTT